MPTPDDYCLFIDNGTLTKVLNSYTSPTVWTSVKEYLIDGVPVRTQAQCNTIDAAITIPAGSTKFVGPRPPKPPTI